MVANEIVTGPDIPQPTSSFYVTPEDCIQGNPDNEPGSDTGHMNCTEQCETNHRAPTIHGLDNVFQQRKHIFRNNTIKRPDHAAFECQTCEHPAFAFRFHGRVLLEPRIMISFGISLAAIIVSFIDAPSIVVFISNSIAIVPLSMTLTFATEKLCQDLGETACAFLNISVGNLAELIIFTALLKNNLRVVQASLLGSILVNLLLVLGSAIIAGGILAPDQIYNADVTHSFVGLLNLTVSCLMIPSAFYSSVKNVHSADDMALSFSRGVSIILLCIYFLYLFFHFKSHRHLFHSHLAGSQFRGITSSRISDSHAYEEVYSDEESIPVPPHTPTTNNTSTSQLEQVPSPLPPENPFSAPSDIQERQGLPMVHIDTTERNGSPSIKWNNDDYGFSSTRNDHSCRNLTYANRTISLGLLVSSPFLIAVCAEFFASSFEALNDKNILGESFVGLIVIPIAGNVAENVTATVVAGKGQMDLGISIALGSAIQIGLLITPVIVLAGWALDKPMSLHFDQFDMVTLVGSVLLVSFIVLKGKTNYLEGAILCACFAAISVGAFLLPIS